MELHAPLTPIPRGVAEAIILCQNDFSVSVLCPYCKTIHRHGTGGNMTYERFEYRGSECHKGEYRFKLIPKMKAKVS